MEEGKYNRDINCLRDREKNIRISSLKRLISNSSSEPNKPELFSRLKPSLLELLQDQSDKCKELSICLLSFLIHQNSMPPEDIPQIIQSFHMRIGTDPILETCEEVRISLINLLFTICQMYKEFVHIELQRITDILAKSCKDKCPEIKMKSCELLIFLAENCKKLGFYGKKIFEHLKANLYHQQYKIRIIALKALKSLLLSQGSFDLSAEIYPNFKKLQLDRRNEVCEVLYEVVYELLKELPDEYLKPVEGKFCYILLSSDTDWANRLADLANFRKEDKTEHSGARLVVMKNIKEIIELCMNDLQE